MTAWEPIPNSPQEEVLRRTETEILFGGARGGGKSEAGLAWCAEPEYIQHPMYRGLVLRRDYDDLSDWIFRAKQFYKGIAEIVGNPAQVRWIGGGVTFLGHWKDKNSISKYIGREFQKILIEEITQGVTTLDEYKLLLGSLRSSFPELNPQIMANTNPGGAGHRWVKKYWIEIPEEETCDTCGGEGCEKCGGRGCVRTGRTVSSNMQPYTDPVSGYKRVFIPSVAKDNPYLNNSYHLYLNSLPEAIKKAWRDGDWDVLEGQFFDSIGLPVKPWVIGPEKARGRLFGSLDVGISHSTSFGLWFLSDDGRFHRLFTYKANGGTHRGHAQAIKERIEGFRWTGGVMPVRVWYGHDANAKSRVNEDSVRSPIDEYKDVFAEFNTRFVVANNDREAGCAVMVECYDENEGVPRIEYWEDFNKSYEEDLRAMMIDENRPETYRKMDGDDTADEARYGIVGLYSYQANEAIAVKNLEKSRRMSRGLVGVEEEYASMFKDTDMG